MEVTGGHTVQWGRWIGEGWQMFVDDWKGWVVRMLVVFLDYAHSTHSDVRDHPFSGTNSRR